MRWSLNEERDFYICWVRGETLDPHSTGKKTELGRVFGFLIFFFFWGQQLLLLLSLSLNFHLTPKFGVPSPRDAIMSQVMLERFVDALLSCLQHLPGSGISVYNTVQGEGSFFCVPWTWPRHVRRAACGEQGLRAEEQQERGLWDGDIINDRLSEQTCKSLCSVEEDNWD